jgi:hypothetical protein
MYSTLTEYGEEVSAGLPAVVVQFPLFVMA